MSLRHVAASDRVKNQLAGRVDDTKMNHGVSGQKVGAGFSNSARIRRKPNVIANGNGAAPRQNPHVTRPDDAALSAMPANVFAGEVPSASASLSLLESEVSIYNA